MPAQATTHCKIIHLGALRQAVLALEVEELAQVVLDEILTRWHHPIGRDALAVAAIQRRAKPRATICTATPPIEIAF